MALYLPGAGGVAWAHSDRKDLMPLIELEDAVRSLKRRGDTGRLHALASSSKSSWARHNAARELASHYALDGEWGNFEKVRGHAGVCALLLHAIGTGDSTRARGLVMEALRGDVRDKACQASYEQAAAAGFLLDDMVWVRIREMVDERRSKSASRLLRLLKDDRVSAAQLNKAVQQATARIKGRHGLGDRSSQELLAVSAVVAAFRNPVLAGRRWELFAPHVSDDINAQVWPIIGKHASLDHESKQALAFYRNAPLSSHGRYELAWRARAAMRLRDWREVRATVGAMTGEQATLSAWRFWHAYALGKVAGPGDSGRLLTELGLEFEDYYGLVARSMTGLPLSLGRSTFDAGDVARMRDNADVRLAIALGVDGRTVKAREIWRHAAQGLSDRELLAAAEVARERGWLLGSVNAADMAAGSVPSHALRFPTPFRDTVLMRTAQFDLDPAFVYAIMRQESRFNPKAISSAGARGLMQVMPATARSVARRHDYTRYNTSRLQLVEVNVLIGTRYIADLRRSMGQDPIVLSATYNAGPRNLKRWLRSSKGVSKLAFVESIPFTETRLYVKHVMANMAHYDLLFNSGARPWADWLTGSYG